jgi:hypothetical protein
MAARPPGDLHEHMQDQGKGRRPRDTERRVTHGKAPSAAIAVALALLAASTLAVAPAFAENVHVLTQTIEGPPGTPLNAPRGIAVDSSGGPSAGSIYVGDTTNHRIVKYNPSGNFLVMWGRQVNEGTGPADLCTNAGAPTQICKAGAAGNGAGWMSQPTGMAVDPSAGPSAGDLYIVPDGGNTGYLEKFDPSGALVTSWGGSPFPGGFDGATAPDGPFKCCSLGRITVDSSGNLYVIRTSVIFKFAQDGSSPSDFTSPHSASGVGLAVDGAGNLFQINSGTGSGSVEKITQTPSDIGQVNSNSPTTTAITYDPVNDDLFAVTSTFALGASVRLYHFNGSGEVVQSDSSTCMPAPSPFSGCEPTETFGLEDLDKENGGPQAVAVDNTTRKVYVANTRSNNIKVFSLINVPKLSTAAASNLARDAAQLNGHVDPDGAGEVTSCDFEYGTTKSYGSSAPCVPGTTPIETDVSAQLPPETLESATLYHYRIVAGNANGSRAGQDETFTTPDAVANVTSDAATNVARLTATINGSFTGDGVDTSYYFDYGPTEEYGQTTPDVDQGTGAGTQSVSANLPSLYAYHLYHYRLVAHNKYGTTYGADEFLHTEAAALPAVETTYVSEVDPVSATLNAQIDLGEGLTVYRFEYGPTEAYGARTLVAGPLDPESPDHTATAGVDQLKPGATYHFRVIATNFTGTTVGPDERFATPSPPIVNASSASSVSRTAATLNGTINPGLGLTTYHFDYGTTPAYGASTPAGTGIGPDSAIHAVSSQISGLAPGTSYHFRAVATNPYGTTYGVDQSFTTLPPEEEQPPQRRPCRKGFVRKHGKCVRRHHKRHHKKHHRHGKRSHG